MFAMGAAAEDVMEHLGINEDEGEGAPLDIPAVARQMQNKQPYANNVKLARAVRRRLTTHRREGSLDDDDESTPLPPYTFSVYRSPEADHVSYEDAKK